MQWNIGKRFAKFEMEDLGGCNVALNWMCIIIIV